MQAGLLIFLSWFTLGFAQDSGVKSAVYDYSLLYEQLSPSIVTVEADGSTGSGFIVDRRGLIATNHHVVHNSRFLAVQFPRGVRVPAIIVRLNARHDLAILLVHPKFIQAPPLKLLSEEGEFRIKAGVPVVAFGSPLNQSFLTTQGIISKVQELSLLGDFLIEPGNSGGPLVDLSGQVIGINTFGVGGIAGAVRVSLLRDTLKGIDISAIENVPDQPLKAIRAERFPTELLKEKILEEPFQRESYTLNAGKFSITAITPVLLGKVQVQDNLRRANNRFKRRGKKISDPSYHDVDEPFYEWHRSIAGELNMAVVFEIKPDFGATSGSKWMSVLGAAAGVPYVHQNMEFKAEFLDFKIFRDGELLVPITPGRRITEASLNQPLMTFVDEAYSGMYTYAPEDFMTGNSFLFEVYDARKPEKPHKVLKAKSDSPIIEQIRQDFREALELLGGGPK